MCVTYLCFFAKDGHTAFNTQAAGPSCIIPLTLQMSPEPSDTPSPEATDRTGVVPESAVQLISPVLHRPQPVTPVKCTHHGDHPVMADTLFKLKLIVTNAGVGIIHRNDPMQNILSIRPLVERQIKLPQLPGCGRKHHAVHSLPEHGQHADPPGRKPNVLSCCQMFPDQRHHLFQRKLFNL